MSASDKVIALRRLLDERFPAQKREKRVVPTGVRAIDDLLGGGLSTGTLTEFVSASPSAGSQLSLGSLILSTRLARQRLALVDAADAFDLEDFDDDAVAHVVWIRSSSLKECWRAADLAARDPNYAVIAIDVRGFPMRDLLRTKDSVWVRLQRAAEQAETTVLVQTDSACVPNAARRIVFEKSWSGGVLTRLRSDLLQSLEVELQRARVAITEVSA